MGQFRNRLMLLAVVAASIAAVGGGAFGSGLRGVGGVVGFHW